MLRFDAGISTGGFGSPAVLVAVQQSIEEFREGVRYVLIRPREQQDHRRWLWQYFAWRIALDHLAWQLVILESRPKPDGPSMPVASGDHQKRERPAQWAGRSEPSAAPEGRMA